MAVNVLRVQAWEQSGALTRLQDSLESDRGHKGPVIKAQVRRGCEVPNPIINLSIYYGIVQN